MSTVEMPRPLRVSPLIKFARWSFLSLGIVYGIFKHNMYSKKEQALREIEAKQKPIRDAKLAAERKIQLEAEKKMIDDWSSGKS